MNFRDQFEVYFIKPVGVPGPIKIGLAESPVRRLPVFQSWSPLLLELMGVVPGRWADEQFLHECLAADHSHGEWFHASPAVQRAVESVLATGNFDEVRATLTPVANVRAKKNRATRALKASAA